MTFLQKTTQAVTLLLVLFMITILALPSEMDLELCFGKDGHVDFLMNNCSDGPAPVRPFKEQSHLYAPAHCYDCRHVVVGCGTNHEFVRAAGNSGIHKTAPKKDPSGAPFLSSAFLAASAGAFFCPTVYPVSPEDISSSNLRFHRTIILLI